VTIILAENLSFIKVRATAGEDDVHACHIDGEKPLVPAEHQQRCL
jgi:hypothetical protein